MEDDGLYLPKIRPHSLGKIRRHNVYADLFTRAMAGKYGHLVYIGLYSGAGKAVIRETGAVVETSALGVIKQAVPFTKYVFVDSNPDCIDALDRRIQTVGGGFDVTFIQRPVNEAVPDILAALPSVATARQEGMLGLCFVDPFKVDLDFTVIRSLSRYWLDFLVMLPLGYDLRRNLRRHLHDETDTNVARLIDAPDWRLEWRARGEPERYLVRFVMRKFDEAMQSLGYRERPMLDTVDIKVTGMAVYLYSLALYSRHERGEQFWRTAIRTADPQFGLPF